jgi:hypothetical protein
MKYPGGQTKIPRYITLTRNDYTLSIPGPPVLNAAQPMDGFVEVYTLRPSDAEVTVAELTWTSKLQRSTTVTLGHSYCTRHETVRKDDLSFFTCPGSCKEAKKLRERCASQGERS